MAIITGATVISLVIITLLTMLVVIIIFRKKVFTFMSRYGEDMYILLSCYQNKSYNIERQLPLQMQRSDLKSKVPTKTQNIITVTAHEGVKV